MAIRESVAPLDIRIRAGIHTGECELVGDKIAGIAVHTAARVMNAAAPGEILVSRTVKDLVAGSGLAFDDRGLHDLKGIPDPLAVVRGRRHGAGSSARPPGLGRHRLTR